MVAYLNMIGIFQIFAQQSPKNLTFGQKSGSLFKFSLNFPVVAVKSRVASYMHGYGMYFISIKSISWVGLVGTEVASR